MYQNALALTDLGFVFKKEMALCDASSVSLKKSNHINFSS